MKFITRVFVSLCIACGIGYTSAWYMIHSGSALTVTTLGPWKIWPHAGDPSGDPYTRAHFAKSGRLAITSIRAYNFNARFDSTANQLSTECDYVVRGPALSSSWWNLTVYDKDGFIMQNKAQRYAFHKDNIFFKEDGSYEIQLSSNARSGNWLPISGSGKFQLVLTVYHGQSNPELNESNPLIKQLPTITKVDC
ncbi:MAG: DUF1214 domain-containing protein [Pseudomonadota bacterium]